MIKSMFRTWYPIIKSMTTPLQRSGQTIIFGRKWDIYVFSPFEKSFNHSASLLPAEIHGTSRWMTEVAFIQGLNQMAEVPDLSSLSPDLFFQSPDLSFQSPDLWEMSPYLCEVCLARRKKTAFSSQTVQVNDTFFADSFVRQYLCLAIPPKWSLTCLPATILPTNHNIYHEKVSYPALAHPVAPPQG